MSMPKFPKHDIIKKATSTFEEGIVTVDQITALHRAWPKESILSELAST